MSWQQKFKLNDMENKGPWLPMEDHLLLRKCSGKVKTYTHPEFNDENIHPTQPTSHTGLVAGIK